MPAELALVAGIGPEGPAAAVIEAVGALLPQHCRREVVDVANDHLSGLIAEIINPGARLGRKLIHGEGHGTHALLRLDRHQLRHFAIDIGARLALNDDR